LISVDNNPSQFFIIFNNNNTKYIKLFRSNSIIFFTSSRYISFGLQFIRGILVAKFLGPSLLGIWGFLMLVQQYLLNTTCGIEYALNVELSINKNKGNESHSTLISTAINYLIFIFIILFLLILVYNFYSIQIFEKYQFGNFSFELFLIICFAELQQVFSNVCRVYDRLDLVVMYEILINILPFAVIFIFSGNHLIHAILISMIVAGFIGNYLFFKKTPFDYSLSIDFTNLKKLLAIGIPLLLYNFSFNLMLITSRTIISIFYSVKEMGLYSLANSLSSAILIGISSIAWAVFPKVLSKLSNDEDVHELSKNTTLINELYSISVLLMIFIAILFLPIVFIFLKEYIAIEPVLVILLLSQGILSNSFAFNSLAIAKKKQITIAFYSFLSIIFIITTSLIFASLKLNIIWIAISTLLGVIVFSILQILFGYKLLGVKSHYLNLIISIYPFHDLFVLSLFLISNFISSGYIIKIIGFVLFLFFNRRKIIQGINFSRSLV